MAIQRERHQPLLLATAAGMALCAAFVMGSAGHAFAQRGYMESSERRESPGLPKLQEALRILDDPMGASSRGAEAEAALRAAIAADPKLEEAHYDLVVYFVHQNKLNEARTAIDAMKAAIPGRAPTLAAEGLVYETTGDRTQAEELYRKATDVDRTAPLPNVYFAGKAVKARSWDDAIRHARMALVGDPSNINAYLDLATAYYEMGSLDLAKLVCLNAIGLNPKAASVHNLLGLVLLEKDDVRGALASFMAAIEADERNVHAYLNAASLTLGYSDFTTALQHFDRALALDPTNQRAKLSRAVALRGLERFDESEAIYGELAGAGGELGIEARYNLCILHNEYTSKYDKALEVCRSLEGDLPADHPKKKELQSRVQGIKTTIDALKGG